MKNESSPEKLQALLVEIFDAVNQNFEDFELLDAIILNSSDEDLEKLFNVETDEELVIELSKLYNKYTNGNISHNSPFRFAIAAPVIWSGLATAGKAILTGLSAAGAYYLGNRVGHALTAKQTAQKRVTLSNSYQAQAYSSKQAKNNTIRTVINKVPSLTAHALSFLRQAQKNVIAQARQEQQSRSRTQIVSQAVSIAQDIANKLAEKRMLEKGRIQHTATNTGGGTSYYTPINATENVVVRIPTAVHSVQSGDSVYGIANKYGISTDDLINWNNIINNFIHPGETLIVRQFIQ